MTAPLDVLVVGAGPTGLALATQLRSYATPLRIVDRSLDRARESRAPAVQPRTPEMLTPFGVADDLADRGNEELLETYEAERAPVGRGVRRLTDRAFTVGTSSHPALRLARTRLAPHVAPLLLRATAARARLFRTVSELAVHYRRGPASITGPHRPRQGPRAGDRLPDTPAGLQRRIAGPGYHFLLTGPDRAWPEDPPPGGRHDLVSVHRLGTRSPWPGITHALVRPDGYVGYLARGTDLTGLRAYLDHWLPAP
ncbi:FAD-dependent monooxygenase [Streptomyces sp. AK010]|uniref:FAD-dependent monooxygenase n=1 Tax=Streptomyces sp. AK010 TaxID=2723074 RepID=UPI0017DEF81D|nr:FAD-dependent monooxygenase [Streptomyces sp. AK010]MBB6417534.1 hypothetical protein [Streptomyces sp. AK010]